jgi:hypothetical protein
MPSLHVALCKVGPDTGVVSFKIEQRWSRDSSLYFDVAILEPYI